MEQQVLAGARRRQRSGPCCQVGRVALALLVKPARSPFPPLLARAGLGPAGTPVWAEAGGAGATGGRPGRSEEDDAGGRRVAACQCPAQFPGSLPAASILGWRIAAGCRLQPWYPNPTLQEYYAAINSGGGAIFFAVCRGKVCPAPGRLAGTVPGTVAHAALRLLTCC